MSLLLELPLNVDLSGWLRESTRLTHRSVSAVMLSVVERRDPQVYGLDSNRALPFDQPPSAAHNGLPEFAAGSLQALNPLNFREIRPAKMLARQVHEVLKQPEVLEQADFDIREVGQVKGKLKDGDWKDGFCAVLEDHFGGQPRITHTKGNNVVSLSPQDAFSYILATFPLGKPDQRDLSLDEAAQVFRLLLLVISIADELLASEAAEPLTIPKGSPELPDWFMQRRDLFIGNLLASIIDSLPGLQALDGVDLLAKEIDHARIASRIPSGVIARAAVRARLRWYVAMRASTEEQSSNASNAFHRIAPMQQSGDEDRVTNADPKFLEDYLAQSWSVPTQDSERQANDGGKNIMDADEPFHCDAAAIIEHFGITDTEFIEGCGVMIGSTFRYTSKKFSSDASERSVQLDHLGLRDRRKLEEKSLPDGARSEYEQKQDDLIDQLHEAQETSWPTPLAPFGASGLEDLLDFLSKAFESNRVRPIWHWLEMAAPTPYPGSQRAGATNLFLSRCVRLQKPHELIGDWRVNNHPQTSNALRQQRKRLRDAAAMDLGGNLIAVEPGLVALNDPTEFLRRLAVEP